MHTERAEEDRRAALAALAELSERISDFCDLFREDEAPAPPTGEELARWAEILDDAIAVLEGGAP